MPASCSSAEQRGGTESGFENMALQFTAHFIGENAALVPQISPLRQEVFLPIKGDNGISTERPLSARESNGFQKVAARAGHTLCWGGRRGELPITDLLITITVEGTDRLLLESRISPACPSPHALQEVSCGHCARQGFVTCKKSVFGKNRATWEVSRIRKGWSSRGCLLGWGMDEAHRRWAGKGSRSGGARAEQDMKMRCVGSAGVAQL